MAITVVTQAVVTEITNTSALSGGEVTGDLGYYKPLVDLLMVSKYQVSNKSRQQVSSSIKTGEILKPFQMFKDTKQANKPFLLLPMRMDLLEDTYEIELIEYNNTDEIKLN